MLTALSFAGALLIRRQRHSSQVNLTNCAQHEEACRPSPRIAASVPATGNRTGISRRRPPIWTSTGAGLELFRQVELIFPQQGFFAVPALA